MTLQIDTAKATPHRAEPTLESLRQLVDRTPGERLKAISDLVAHGNPDSLATRNQDDPFEHPSLSKAQINSLALPCYAVFLITAHTLTAIPEFLAGVFPSSRSRPYKMINLKKGSDEIARECLPIWDAATPDQRLDTNFCKQFIGLAAHIKTFMFEKFLEDLDITTPAINHLIELRNIIMPCRLALTFNNMRLAQSAFNLIGIPWDSKTEHIASIHEGLMRATLDYNPFVGRFSTHAVHNIRAAIQNEHTKASSEKKHASRLRSTLRLLAELRLAYIGDHDFAPTEEALYAILLASPRCRPVHKAGIAALSLRHGHLPRVFSLSERIPGTNGLVTETPSPNPGPAELVAKQELPTSMARILDRASRFMPERNRDRWLTALTLRFGLNGEGTHTLQEIGEKLGVTHECVRQIINAALRWLKTYLESTNHNPADI